MCFGGKSSGPSAAEMYAKQKVNYGALPSLSQKKSDREAPKMEDVETPEQRVGTMRRSLLNPYG
tara:strand:- start:33 stop:224 length:192 start_codon:yes stop_codon:yes gene_type:complete